MRIIDGFQLFCCVSTDNHTRVVPYFTRRVWPPRGPYTTQNMVQPVYDYPRRYTAKQLKTIYYSLILSSIRHDITDVIFFSFFFFFPQSLIPSMFQTFTSLGSTLHVVPYCVCLMYLMYTTWRMGETVGVVSETVYWKMA